MKVLVEPYADGLFSLHKQIDETFRVYNPKKGPINCHFMRSFHFEGQQVDQNELLGHFLYQKANNCFGRGYLSYEDESYDQQLVSQSLVRRLAQLQTIKMTRPTVD